MGQSESQQWWEVIVGILSVPTSIFAMIYLYLQIQKIQLEIQKTKLENFEKEKKLYRGTKKSSAKFVKSDAKSKSILHKILFDIETIENKMTNLIYKILSPLNISQNKSSKGINGQRIVGSTIEFFLFLSFIYADASLMAQNIAILIPTITIPSPFTEITLPLVVATVGTSLALGLIIGDLLELTNFTLWVELRSKKKLFLAIILPTLIISMFLSVLIALAKFDLIPAENSGLLLASSLAQNLITIPLFITTALLFSATQGILSIVALVIILLRLPITITRKIFAKIIFYTTD